MWQRIVGWDEVLVLALRSLEVPWATRLMRAVTRLGEASSWLLVGLVLLAGGGPGVTHALLLWTAATFAVALSQVVKRICRRRRPAVRLPGFTALVEDPDHFSFPSGHTAVAFSVAIALAGEGLALGPLMLGLACLIGVSRVYLGAHYPLDVGAGAAVGILTGWLARLLLF